MQWKPYSPSAVDSGYNGKEGKSRGYREGVRTGPWKQTRLESKDISTAPLPVMEGIYWRQPSLSSEPGSDQVLWGVFLDKHNGLVCLLWTHKTPLMTPRQHLSCCTAILGFPEWLLPETLSSVRGGVRSLSPPVPGTQQVLTQMMYSHGLNPLPFGAQGRWRSVAAVMGGQYRALTTEISPDHWAPAAGRSPHSRRCHSWLCLPAGGTAWLSMVSFTLPWPVSLMTNGVHIGRREGTAGRQTEHQPMGPQPIPGSLNHEYFVLPG